MPITPGKYHRKTIDFTDKENDALETRVRELGCHMSKFVRAAVAFAIKAGLQTIDIAPPTKKQKIEHEEAFG